MRSTVFILSARSMFRHRKGIALALATAAWGATFGGCGISDAITNVADSVNATANILRGAIHSLDINSAQWQDIVRGVIKDLPATENDIKADVDEVLQRAIGGASTELIATADFFAARMKTGLERELAKILNQPFVEPPPAFLSFVPDKVEVERVQSNNLNSVTVFGYDFDKKDPSGNKMKLFRLDGNTETPLPDTMLTFPTHYKAIFNIGSNGVTLPTGANQLILKWNNQPISTLAVIQPPPPMPEDTIVRLTSFSYTPPHTRGDEDFDGNGPKVNLKCLLAGDQFTSGGCRTLIARVWMKAEETEDDWTTAEGWSDWTTVYTAPPGKVITNILSPVSCDASYVDTNHTMDSITLGVGDLVKQFDCVGDTTSDHDAGRATSVVVIFNDIHVLLLKQ